MGDREARYGVSFGLSGLRGSDAATPIISLWGNLVPAHQTARCWRMPEEGNRTSSMQEILISMLET